MYSTAKNLLSISIYAVCLISTVILITLVGDCHLALAEQAPTAVVANTATPPVEDLSAASLFTANCAGCHAGGGNVIRRGKNLKQKALAKYGYDNAEAIAQIITHGRGIMPAYSDRLNADEMSAIAQYVLTQAENGW